MDERLPGERWLAVLRCIQMMNEICTHEKRNLSSVELRAFHEPLLNGKSKMRTNGY